MCVAHLRALFQAYGVDLGAKMCKYLLANGIPGLHMYSLNMEKSALAILERVGFIDNHKVCLLVHVVCLLVPVCVLLHGLHLYSLILSIIWRTPIVPNYVNERCMHTTAGVVAMAPTPRALELCPHPTLGRLFIPKMSMRMFKWKHSHHCKHCCVHRSRAPCPLPPSSPQAHAAS